jgi:glycosyltransferase involved in cell wall biosynthesis
LKIYLDRVVPRSARRADHILADSQATKDDLISIYNLPTSKITVLLSGVDVRFHPIDDRVKLQAVREKYKIGPSPYIFSVGTVQPRKNYGRLIQALSQLRARGYPHHLVIAGGKGWLEDPIYQTMRETSMEEAVHFIGFADEADLPTLYSAAACFAFPSLYEGFGIPVLESMACGTPVVTSNVSSLPEAAGNAALLVDPYSLDEIATALVRLIDEAQTRERLVELGHQHVRNFTWTKAAEQLRSLYTSLL